MTDLNKTDDEFRNGRPTKKHGFGSGTVRGFVPFEGSKITACYYVHQIKCAPPKQQNERTHVTETR